jgi:hypothetical protein
MEPEQSAIQKKCKGRLISLPPGRFSVLIAPSCNHRSIFAEVGRITSEVLFRRHHFDADGFIVLDQKARAWDPPGSADPMDRRGLGDQHSPKFVNKPLSVCEHEREIPAIALTVFRFMSDRWGVVGRGA